MECLLRYIEALAKTRPKSPKQDRPEDRLSYALLKKEILRKKYGVQIGFLVLYLTRERNQSSDILDIIKRNYSVTSYTSLEKEIKAVTSSEVKPSEAASMGLPCLVPLINSI